MAYKQNCRQPSGFWRRFARVHSTGDRSGLRRLDESRATDGPGTRSTSLFRALATIAVVSIAAAYAYCRCFSWFSPYDDEGFMMVSVQGMLEGHALYDAVFTGYGPFYYLYELLVHSALALPVTHDATRWLCLAHWLIASSVLGLAGARMTRSTV